MKNVNFLRNCLLLTEAPSVWETERKVKLMKVKSSELENSTVESCHVFQCGVAAPFLFCEMFLCNSGAQHMSITA